jgi:two-component system nitrate/nitrite response regulator NarL
VLVADDHPVYRTGLVQALTETDECQVVDAVADGDAALAAIRRHSPDVAVLDVRMGAMPGPEVLTAVRQQQLRTRVLLLSAYVDAAMIHHALAGGAAGVLSKESTDDEIRGGVLAAAAGEIVVSRNLHGAVFAEIRRNAVAARAKLSGREREILRLAADGHGQAEIARRLFLSETTVKTYMRRVFEKLDVSDRTAAVAKAIRSGLLE